MIHDLLCPMSGATMDVLTFAVFKTGQAIYCGCDLIARVREDEAKRIYSDEAMEAVIRLAASKAYDAALQDALAAVPHHDQCHAVQYAEYGEPCDCWREDAVAQIEALGGAR